GLVVEESQAFLLKPFQIVVVVAREHRISVVAGRAPRENGWESREVSNVFHCITAGAGLIKRRVMYMAAGHQWKLVLDSIIGKPHQVVIGFNATLAPPPGLGMSEGSVFR